ncbi:hypothetical protein JTB14_000679 [Gonioctena quinquepunctata]|nr:hypothetical protein JTB14_000679 [Gonioctena quinquepunctata]
MLYVNNKTYSVEDLEQSEASAEINEKSNSAPGTPSSQNHHKTAEKTILTTSTEIRNRHPSQPQQPLALEKNNSLLEKTKKKRKKLKPVRR